jgi:hypothetical protein
MNNLDVQEQIERHWKDDAPRLVPHDQDRAGLVTSATVWLELNLFLSPTDGPKMAMIARSVSEWMRFLAFEHLGYPRIRDAFFDHLPANIPEEAKAIVKVAYCCSTKMTCVPAEGGFEVAVFLYRTNDNCP